MRFGAHLPQIDFEGRARWSADHLIAYARTAERLGFDALCVNDHLVFPKPWLEALTALALVASHTERVQLMTTVSLPAIRGPVALAKALASLDVMSGGRVVAGVGPGSSRLDYEAAGVPFEERWKRLDEAVRAMQSLWDPARSGFSGRFYSTEGVALEPLPHQPGGPPIWIGSWGSDAGMRRVARLANGWLGSAYNTEPHLFRSAREVLNRQLEQQGRDPGTFPNAIATGFMYVTPDANEARRVRRDVIAPMIRRDEGEVERRLLIGPAGECVEKLSAYAEAGAQAFFVWPIADEIEQLELFAADVAPKVG